MFLHSSNRMEVLLAQLVEVVQRPLESAFQAEAIVVQSYGMERWIAMALAERLGIWANGRFYFPREAVWDIFQRALPNIPNSSAFEPETLVWAIMRVLPDYLPRPAFAELKTYLQGERTTLKRYQLAHRLANLFDQYVIFRPDLLIRWEQGQETHWQAELWRGLVAILPGQHRAAIRELFFQAVNHNTLNLRALPPRLSVFGISALPPFFMQIFWALSAYREVHLFVMNPCREYWGDIMAGSEQVYYTLRNGKAEGPLHLTKGNSLLASMGKLGRDYLDLLQDTASQLQPTQEIEAFDLAPGTTVLAQLQNDLLQLQERGEDTPVLSIASTDRSLQIHSCHSPMREVEVLYDQLLALFAAEPDLLPHEIIVMMPEIEQYAAYIQAVFNTRLPNQPVIPFSISDRGPQAESAIISSFLNLLRLHQSRFEVSTLLAILDDPSVQRCFDISPADRVLIQHWVSDVHICWGLDEQGRVALGLPEFRENSWWFGLDRLLLGYALSDGNSDPQLFADILPYPQMEGHDSLALGKLVVFIRRLQALALELPTLKTIPVWVGYLNQVLPQFFDPERELESELQRVRDVLHSLLTTCQVAQYSEAIGIEVVLAFLQQELAAAEAVHGFLQGRVTFCSMVPMRSIPFKVVCLLGLNDAVYPRSLKPLSFDLMAQEPRKGDRSRRQDDRYLFLESLLSARQYLYLSFVGQSIQDNSSLPPSVVVAELQDYLDRGFRYNGKPAGRALVCCHPLQAFSQSYFLPPVSTITGADAWRISYSHSYASASRALSAQRRESEPFIHPPFTAVPSHSLTLAQWLSFFRHPVKFLLQERLKITLNPPTSLLAEREPMALSTLDQFMLTQQRVKQLLAQNHPPRFRGHSPDDYALCKAGGILPLGVPGELIFQQIQEKALALVETIRHYQGGSLRETLWFDRVLAGQRLTGGLEALGQEYQVFYAASKLNAKAMLLAWVQHLLLNWIAPVDYPRRTVVLATDQGFCWHPVADAEAKLLELMQWYLQGLCQPLPLFPQASREYMMVLRKHHDEAQALNKAEQIWRGGDWATPERDGYIALCFADEFPRQAFAEVTQQVWEPLLDGGALL